MRSRFGGAIQRALDGQPRKETAGVADLDCHDIGKHTQRKLTAVEICRANELCCHATQNKQQGFNFEYGPRHESCGQVQNERVKQAGVPFSCDSPTLRLKRKANLKFGNAPKRISPVLATRFCAMQ